MALAVASERGRKRKWWNERAIEKAGISLEEAIRQSKPSYNGHDATGMAYVFILPEISVSRLIPHGMTAAERKMWQDHRESVAEFNKGYDNRGIEQVVENTHRNIFGKALDKVYDAAANG